MIRRSKALTAALAATAALGVGGVAVAATDDSANDRAAAMAEALSEQVGSEVSVEDLLAARQQVATDRVEQALADGEITQEQADERLEAIANGEHPGHGERGHRSGAGPLEDVAESLGLDLESAREALRLGDTLAEYAESQGVSRGDLVAAIVQSMSERVTEHGDQAPDAETLTERAEALVDGERPERPFGGPGGPGHRG